MTKPTKRGGWRNPASAANGAKVRNPGRKRRKLIRHRGESAVMLRNGDTVAVLDGVMVTPATVSIDRGMLILTSENGKTLRIVISE